MSDKTFIVVLHRGDRHEYTADHAIAALSLFYKEHKPALPVSVIVNSPISTATWYHLSLASTGELWVQAESSHRCPGCYAARMSVNVAGDARPEGHCSYRCRNGHKWTEAVVVSEEKQKTLDALEDVGEQQVASDDESDPIKQVIVYRRDLKMRKGKIAAQVAHASLQVFLDRSSIAPAGAHLPNLWMVGLNEDMKTWIEGLFTKVVLSVESDAELVQIYESAVKAAIPVSKIIDLGKTEFHGIPTLTTVALGPARSSLIDMITGKEGLVKTKLA